MYYQVRNYCEDCTSFKYISQAVLDPEWKASGCSEHTVRDFTVLAHYQRACKSGYKAADDFSGTPKKATVTFPIDFPDINYSFIVLGADERNWTYESKAAGSIVINSGSDSALTGDCFWIAIEHYNP